MKSFSENNLLVWYIQAFIYCDEHGDKDWAVVLKMAKKMEEAI